MNYVQHTANNVMPGVFTENYQKQQWLLNGVALRKKQQKSWRTKSTTVLLSAGAPSH